MHALKLRSYQTEAIEAVREALTSVNRTAVVLPTGMGKTVLFAHLIAAEIAQSRVLVLVHRDELAEQAKDKIHSVAPDARIGIVKAERNEIDADVIVASVQTLARPKRREQIENVGLIIVDECHHATARTWREVLTHFGAFDPVDDGKTVIDAGTENVEGYGEVGFIRLPRRTPCVGFTATLARGDGEPLGDVWESVAYECEIEWGIERGFLVDVRGQQVDVKGLDLNSVSRSRGDFADSSLAAAMLEADAGDEIARAYVEHAGSKRGILFAPTVETAENFADALNARGVVTEVITGETPKEERELAYKKFRSGDVQVLSNCMVLTEGFDAPHAEVAVIARPTQSAPLYTQMVGRVLRPFPGKDEALVLDVVGVTGRHQLQSLTSLTKRTVKPGESIIEAKERNAVEAGLEAERREIRGLAASRKVELFASSHSVWLKTYGGTDFIPIRGGAVVLWEKPDGSGLYSVGVKMDRQPGEWRMSGVTLEYAMSWGEQIAGELDPMVADRDRSWRRTKPSEKQIDLALRMKLAPAEEIVNMRKGALSDLLSTHFASRALKALDASRV